MTVVLRTHLRLDSAHLLRPAARPPSSVDVKLRALPRISVTEYRELYRRVGEPWHWRDRTRWDDTSLQRHLNDAGVIVWRLDFAGDLAGFFELRHDASGDVELMYFGLVPECMGQGLGGWLLTRAAEEAFAQGAARIIVNTCTLDAPAALPNYLARGFTVVGTDEHIVDD